MHIASWLQQILLGVHAAGGSASAATSSSSDDVSTYVVASETVKLSAIRTINIIVFGAEHPQRRAKKGAAEGGVGGVGVGGESEGEVNNAGLYVFEVLLSILPEAFKSWFRCMKVIHSLTYPPTHSPALTLTHPLTRSHTHPPLTRTHTQSHTHIRTTLGIFLCPPDAGCQHPLSPSSPLRRIQVAQDTSTGRTHKRWVFLYILVSCILTYMHAYVRMCTRATTHACV